MQLGVLAVTLGPSLTAIRFFGIHNYIYVHSACLRNPWTEEPGRLQSMESQRVRHDLVT